MAVYIKIRKESENQISYIYKYTLTDGSISRLEINKNDGSIRPLQKLNGESDQRPFSCVSWKLAKHFKEGEFPEETFYAA